nr:hypothetical protein [Acidovorax sp. NO-1]
MRHNPIQQGRLIRYLAQQCRPAGFVRVIALGNHPAALDQVVARGEPYRLAHVLLDEHDGNPLAGELPDQQEQLLHDHRRQSLGVLVDQQPPQRTGQHARDRQHLLLAARLRAGHCI